MKISLKYYLLFFFFISSASVFSQLTEGDDDEDDSPPKHRVGDDGTKQYFVISPRLNVTVPHAIADNSYRQSFEGIYQVNGGVNVYIYKGIFIGATATDGDLELKGIAGYTPTMNIYNAGGKVGSDIYLGERNRVIFSAALAYGNNWTHYYGLTTKEASTILSDRVFQATYIEPEVDLYFLVEDNFGVGLTVSYNILNHTFNPATLGLTDWAEFNSSPSGTTQTINYGISVYYSFWRKKLQPK